MREGGLLGRGVSHAHALGVCEFNAIRYNGGFDSAECPWRKEVSAYEAGDAAYVTEKFVFDATKNGTVTRSLSASVGCKTG